MHPLQNGNTAELTLAYAPVAIASSPVEKLQRARQWLEVMAIHGLESLPLEL